MGFDGEAFVTRFNTVWNGHDLEGILAMMTADVIFEASFGNGTLPVPSWRWSSG
jgi:hypothetical protein